MNAIATNTAGAFLLALIPRGAVPKTFFDSFSLSSPIATALAANSQEDARKYVYNAVISFLSGISCLKSFHSSWSITKMYYTVFYIGRSALSRNGHVIFHVPKPSGNGTTQYEISAKTGERATIVHTYPSTHKLVAERFRQNGYPSFMQSLQVDGDDPIIWLMKQREFWQYKSGRFPDPDLPNVLECIEFNKLQRYLAEYLNDRSGVFLADPSHAILSIPYRLLMWALSIDRLYSPGIIDDADIRFLSKSCIIGRHKLANFDKYFRVPTS
jgi:hypothetical protein